MQSINPINTHTKFGKDRINTFPSNEQKPSVRMPDDGKSKNMSTPHWGGHNYNILIQTDIPDMKKQGTVLANLGLIIFFYLASGNFL